MDHRVQRLRSPAECEIFAMNATALKRPDLALEARRRAVDMQASTHETTSPVEAEAFASVYALEALLAKKNGKKTRASTTWHAVKRYGIIEAIQRGVSKPPEPNSYKTLTDMGLGDLAFEALVVRHAASFSEEAVQISKDRLAEKH
jgi:hypothetical protein